MELNEVKELLNDIPNKFYWYQISKSIRSNTDTFILVKAIDAKYAYGKIRVLVRPIVSKGEDCWIEYKNLSLEELPYGFIALRVNEIQKSINGENTNGRQ